MITLLVLGWIVSGLLAAGWLFAYECAEFLSGGGKREDLSFSVFFGLFGPYGMVVAFFLTGFRKHGWRLWS